MARARLFLPGSVSPVGVEVTATIDGLHLAGPAVELDVAFAAIAPPRGDYVTAGTLQLEWDRHALIAEGAAEIAALQALLPPELARAASAADQRARTSSKRGIYAALALIVGFPLSLVLFKDPIVGATVKLVPVSADQELGELLHEQLKSSGKLIKEGPAVDGVRAIGARLLATAPEHPYAFRFEVIDEPSVNAFAAPGGLVVVHAGLIRTASSAEELAGVLGHELVHVLHRHSMRQIVFKVGFLGTLSLLVGSGEGLAEIVAMLAIGLGDLGFSRDQERDADRAGIALLERAKIPPQGLVTFFTKLGEDARVPAMLSTHPAPKERISELERMIAERPPWPTEPIAVDWAAMKASVTR